MSSYQLGIKLEKYSRQRTDSISKCPKTAESTYVGGNEKGLRVGGMGEGGHGGVKKNQPLVVLSGRRDRTHLESLRGH